jgi:hypothetical protein
MPIVNFQTLDNPIAEIISTDNCCDTSYETLSNILCNVATIMPFRVNFQTIDIGGYSPSNPAPIGIAIIGFNNYIL